LKELAELRLLLEGHAMEASFARADMEWEGRVVAAHHKLSRLEQSLIAGKHADAETWKRYDWEFHRALISGCGSAALLDTHAGIYDKDLRYHMIAVIFRVEVAAIEHRQLLECAFKRNAAKACKILKRHIDACVDYTVSSGRLSLMQSSHAPAISAVS
jgi:DNA-binding GntR family transcriptional regulator